MRVGLLSGVVYMTKKRRPRTDLCGIPQKDVCKNEKLFSDLTRRDPYYFLNVIETGYVAVSDIHNHIMA